MLMRPLLLLLTVSMLALAPAGWAQTNTPGGDPPIAGMDKLSPDEQARVRQNLERWKSMTPAQRAQVLQDFQRWNDLPEERRRELERAHERFQKLPPERQQQIMERL